MKRLYGEFDRTTPPMSPRDGGNPFESHKKINTGRKGLIPDSIVPALRAKALDPLISLILNEMVYKEDDMRDELDSYNVCVKILMFLDAQGNQFIDYFQTVLSQLDSKALAIIVTSNIEQSERTRIPVTENHVCEQLSRYFGVLSPMGGGTYPLNHLIVVSNNAMRVKIALKLNNFNPFERFGVMLPEVTPMLQEILPFI